MRVDQPNSFFLSEMITPKRARADQPLHTRPNKKKKKSIEEQLPVADQPITVELAKSPQGQNLKSTMRYAAARQPISVKQGSLQTATQIKAKAGTISPSSKTVQNQAAPNPSTRFDSRSDEEKLARWRERQRLRNAERSKLTTSNGIRRTGGW